ncbi:hypothetical protein ACWDTI_15075 [Gordonia sp. NPDC003424]
MPNRPDQQQRPQSGPRTPQRPQVRPRPRPFGFLGFPFFGSS